MNLNKYLKKPAVIILIFSILLIIFVILYKKLLLTDTGEYISVAKYFTSNLNSNIRTTHSLFYGLFLSIFLKIYPSIITIKLVNLAWISLITILLFKITRSNKILLLWIFSPIVWYMAPWISPILPATFFLLLSYRFLKSSEEKSKYKYLFLSGAVLGIATLFWETIIITIPFFLLAFFFNKNLKDILVFLIPLSLFASFRLFLDYLFFQFPLFSLSRFFGANFLSLTKQVPRTPIPLLRYTFLIFILSPIALWFSEINYKKYKRELSFIGLYLILFIVNNQPRFLFAIAPFFFITANYLKKRKKFLIHIILSIIVISIIFYQGFTYNQEEIIVSDLNKIGKDFPNQTFFAGNEDEQDAYLVYSTLYWGKDIKEFISWQDLTLVLEDKQNFQKHTFQSNSKIGNTRNVWFSFGLSRVDTRNYSDINYLISSKDSTTLPNFVLEKSYNNLNVFKKQTKSI